ncbi:class I SAM-dependent methyltransferase [Bacteroidota bacterium]
MLARFFVFLTNIHFFRTLFWKPVYNLMASRIPDPDWQMMNYGYKPTSEEEQLPLNEKDEYQRYPLQMYHYLASLVGIKDKDVVEVGCGRGGGAGFLYNYHKPGSYVGIDIAKKSTDFCNRLYEGKTLSFITASADKLPFGDQSFDVLINVESSHAYANVPKFLTEVSRVLRADGYILLVDFRAPENNTILKQQMQAAGFEILKEENITENVVEALDASQQSINDRISTQVPKYLHSYFKEFAAAKGSFMNTAFRNKEIMYYRYLARKKGFTQKKRAPFS